MDEAHNDAQQLVLDRLKKKAGLGESVADAHGSFKGILVLLMLLMFLLDSVRPRRINVIYPVVYKILRDSVSMDMHSS